MGIRIYFYVQGDPTEHVVKIDQSWWFGYEHGKDDDRETWVQYLDHDPNHQGVTNLVRNWALVTKIDVG